MLDDLNSIVTRYASSNNTNSLSRSIYLEMLTNIFAIFTSSIYPITNSQSISIDYSKSI